MSSTQGDSSRGATRPVDTRFLCTFFGLVYFLQSLGDPSSGVVAQPLRSLLRRWEESPSDIALFMAVLSLPWAIKPVFGLISDYFPIFGSRRRLYLILSCAAAALGFSLLSVSSVVPGDYRFLLALLMLPALGVAFSDVLVDGIMIDEGRPRGLTGLFQSVQWTAGYGGMLLTGVVGGYLSQIGRPEVAFGFCALFWAIALMLALYVTEEKALPESSRPTLQSARELTGFVSDRHFLALCAFLFLWNVNPLWTTVLYIHMTEVAGFSETSFGHMISTFSFGCMLASALYPLYCRKLSLGTLFTIAIVTGVIANVFYLLMDGAAIVYLIALAAGMAYMTGTMIQMDIAARRVPLAAAATLFALLMGLSNLGASVGEAIGGALYEAMTDSDGDVIAYRVIVLLSAVIPLVCLPFRRWVVTASSLSGDTR